MDTSERKRIKQECNIQFFQTLHSNKRIKVHQGGSRCLIGSSLVRTENSYIPIKDIQIGQEVFCKSDDGKLVLKKVIDKFLYTDEQLCRKLIIFELINGSKLTCTYDHRWFTKNGYSRAIDIAKRVMERNSKYKGKISNFKSWKNKNIELQKFKSASYNETSKRCKRLLSNNDFNKWQIFNNKDSQISGSMLYYKFREQATSKSYQQQSFGQSSSKSGVGYSSRKYGSYDETRQTNFQQRFKEWNGKINGSTSYGDSKNVQTLCNSEKRYSRDLWSKHKPHKRYCSEKNLEAFALDLPIIRSVKIIESNQPVYDIEIEDYHNFLVSESNIISHNSGKTYAICQYLIYKITSSSSPLTISIVRKTLPALKGSVQRDLLEIFDNIGILHLINHNKAENTISFNNHLIEFLSVDEPQKIRGRKRNICYCNEVNELDFEDFRQLLMRTTDEMICDFNPSDPVHWIYDEVITRDDCDTWITTYRDNKFLPIDLINEIERLRERDLDYWRVFGEGQRAMFSDRQIFNNWKFIPKAEFPEFDEIFYGLDFGFSQDPTAIVQVGKINDKIYVHEVCYRKGMTNRDIASFFKEIKALDSLVYCDSAEPKSLEELRQMGILAIEAIKGQGSINAGISFLKEFEIIVSKESTNLEREYRFYFWEQLKDGTIINKPIDKHNHLIDGFRYSVYTKYKNRNEFFVI